MLILEASYKGGVGKKLFWT